MEVDVGEIMRRLGLQNVAGPGETPRYSSPAPQPGNPVNQMGMGAMNQPQGTLLQRGEALLRQRMQPGQPQQQGIVEQAQQRMNAGQPQGSAPPQAQSRFPPPDVVLQALQGMMGQAQAPQPFAGGQAQPPVMGQPRMAPPAAPAPQAGPVPQAGPAPQAGPPMDIRPPAQQGVPAQPQIDPNQYAGGDWIPPEIGRQLAARQMKGLLG